MIFDNVNLYWLTCLKNLEVPLQVAIMTWFNNIQRKDLNQNWTLIQDILDYTVEVMFYTKFNLELNTKVKENSSTFATVLYTSSNGRGFKRNNFWTMTGFAGNWNSGQIAGLKEN
jgi:hypothetical protein